MLIDPIESVEGAESIIANAALAFTAFGALQLMVGIFIVIQTGAITVLAIGALIPCVAYLLKQTNSRVLAGVLWMYMGIELIVRAWIVETPQPRRLDIGAAPSRRYDADRLRDGPGGAAVSRVEAEGLIGRYPDRRAPYASGKPKGNEALPIFAG